MNSSLCRVLTATAAIGILLLGTLAATPAIADDTPIVPFDHTGDPADSEIQVPGGTKAGTIITVTQEYEPGTTRGLFELMMVDGNVEPVFEVVRVSVPEPMNCFIEEGSPWDRFICGTYGDLKVFPTTVQYTLKLKHDLRHPLTMRASIYEQNLGVTHWPSTGTPVFDAPYPVADALTPGVDRVVAGGESVEVPLVVTGDQFGSPAGTLDQTFTTTAGAVFTTATVREVGPAGERSYDCTLNPEATVLHCPASSAQLTVDAPTVTTFASVSIPAAVADGDTFPVTTTITPTAGFTNTSSSTSATTVLTAEATTITIPEPVTPEPATGTGYPGTTAGQLPATGSDPANPLIISLTLLALGLGTLLTIHTRRTRRSRP